MVRRPVVGLCVVCVVLTVAAALAGVGYWVDLGSGFAGAAPSVEVLDLGERVTVTVDLPGFYAEDRTNDRGDFTVIDIPEFGRRGELGRPELPFRTVLVPVANGPRASLAILDTASFVAMTGVTVMPRQAPEPDCGPGLNDFTMDAKAYAADRWYPEAPARIASEVVVRGQRFLVIEVSPLAFNPVRGEVAARSNLRLDITLEGPVDHAAENLKALRRSVLFPTHADAEGVDAPKDNPTGVEYLIVADDPLIPALEPLAAWKRLKGLTTEIVAISTIGSTFSDLRDYLQNRYDNDPDLTYVLLAGDYPAIPSEWLSGGYGSYPSDLRFSCLDGSDYLADIVLGRLAVETLEECQNVIAKILAFDRDVVPGAWQGDYLMAAYLQDYSCQAERFFFETGTHAMHFIRDEAGMGIHTSATTGNLSCDPYLWRDDASYYNHRPSGYAGQPVPAEDAALMTNATTATQDITDAINAGVSLVQHRDHGGETGWGDPPFHNTEVNNLANGDMTPIVYSVNCLTGSFDISGDSFAEALMKKYPGGAVGVYAATDVSYSGWNDLLVHGSYDCFWDGYDTADGGNPYPHSFRPSEAYLYGKYYMFNWQGDNEDTLYEFELFHWHGDPEMRALTAVPAVATVTTETAIPVGSTTLTVNADAEGALVAVTDNGVLIGRGFVVGGVAIVNLTPPPEEPTTLDVVVSGHNLVPWQGAVEVIVPNGPWMAFRSYILDDSSGNGDGIANPGEALVLPVTVENIGADDGAGISGALSSGSALVTVTDPVAAFPDATVGAQVQSLSDHFAVAVDAAAANGHVANLTLAWTAAGGYSGNTVFPVPVCEHLTISNVSVDSVDHESATVSWTTNVPASSRLNYGLSTPDTLVEVPGTRTSHVITVEGLDPCAEYVFEVASSSPNCYTAEDDNGGSYYSVETDGWQAFYSEVFDTDPGWAIDNGSEPAEGWAFGQPTGEAQDTYGGPDPTAGATGDSVYGVNLGGDIPADLSDNELKLTSPVVDLSAANSVQVRFQRWLGVEQDSYDHARIRLSVDGGLTWDTVWENGGSTIDDTQWSEMIVELPAAAGQSQVQVQWTYGSTDGSWNYCGWNIDDVVIEGGVSCSAMAGVFADGFEGGDLVAWDYSMP